VEAAVLTSDGSSNDQNEGFLRGLSLLSWLMGRRLQNNHEEDGVLRRFESKREGSEPYCKYSVRRRIFSANRECEGPYL